MARLDSLRELLSRVAPGEIVGPQASEVTRRLVEAWTELAGHDYERTDPMKVSRAESLRYEPPHLFFVLERHGGTVNGSTRATLHHWKVDLDHAKAKIIKQGYRQLKKMDDRFYAKDEASIVAKLVLNHQLDECLKWSEEGKRVTINMSEIVPDSFQRTVQGRRKRFKEELDKLLIPQGWARSDRGSRLSYVWRGATPRDNTGTIMKG